MRSGWARKAALAAAAALLPLILAEALVRAAGLDLRALGRVLYWVEDEGGYAGGKKLYRASADAERLFEAIPGADAACDGCSHPLERRYRDFRFHVNRLGFRGEEVHAEKPAGVFRVIVFGGSTTWGPRVADADTYPAALERLLNASAPPGRRFQVWNAGLDAYQLSQEVAYADQTIPRFHPDLVIFQVWNRGRRAFMFGDPDYARLFAKNPELYSENLPLTDRAARMRPAHEWLLRRLALYRLLVVALDRALRLLGDPRRAAPETARRGDEISRRDFLAFAKRHRELDILLFEPFGDRFGRELAAAFKGRVRYLSIAARLQGRPPEYREVHPPSYVYAFYAEELRRWLCDGRLTTGLSCGRRP